MFKSIIFDMDGTLLDSSYALTCSVNHVRSTIGLSPVSKEFLEFYINEPDQDLPMKFYETKEFSPVHQQLFREHYMENVHLSVKPYAGVLELLEYLKSTGATLSVATNAADYFAKHMLEYCKMSDFFTHIIGSNNVENRKPSPDMIEHLVKATSISLEKTVLVGDSVKDEFAAMNAQVDFIFADWGYGQSKTAKKRFDKVDDMHHYFTTIL